ncbi:mtTFB2 family protein [Megaselia abdita]
MFALSHFKTLRNTCKVFQRYVVTAAALKDKDVTPKNKSNKFPEKLLNKKSKNPSHFYLANDAGSKMVFDEISAHLKKLNKKPQVFYEINPGTLSLTKLLLDDKDLFQKLVLIENHEDFIGIAEEYHSLYPDRVKVYHRDFVNIWKLLYQDKMDNGSRVSDLLIDLPKQPYEQEPSVAIFSAVGSYNFFKHIINSLVFQTSFLSYGRCDLYFVIPPPIYIHLTCNRDIGYLLYRATTMLFQIFFEYKFLKKIPREYFLPNPTLVNLSKEKKLAKIKSINSEYLYLVHMVPRKNLHELCAQEDLQALWYFVKQNCVSRKNRVIPTMEKFVPNCGPRLIMCSESAKLDFTYAEEKKASLPQYSIASFTISNKNHFPYMNIFTQFGDMNPSQMLSLFSEFRSWPEYAVSPFLASLENCLLKLEVAEEQDINEDDDPQEESSQEIIESSEERK